MVVFRTVALLCATLMLAASPAHAQPERAASVANDRTTQLWEEGKARAQEGRWEEAWAAFSQAYALNPTLNIRYNLAISALYTKRHVQAARLMSEIVDTCDATCPEKIRSTAPERLQEAEQHVGRISVRTSGGARIQVDGESVDQEVARKTWHVSPGSHVVVIQTGEHPVTRNVDVAAGQQRVVDATLQPAGAPSSTAPTPGEAPLEQQASADSYRAPILVLGVGLTAVSLGIATGFTVKAGSADQEADRLRSEIGGPGWSQCTGSAATLCDDLNSANEDRENAAMVAKISWVLTGVLGAGTVATYFLWPETTTTAALTIVPVGTDQLGGLVVRGAF